MTRNHYKHLQMEGYIPSADAAAPGRTSNKTQEQTTPDQPRSRAASGEMPPFGSSLAQHTFDDPDLRRDTFSNEDVIAGQLDNMAGQRDSVSFPNRRFQNVLDMSDPAYSAPGTDFLLAAEYIVGGNTYDAGEVLDANSFPELEQERSLRIADILRGIHQPTSQPTQQSSTEPSLQPSKHPSVQTSTAPLVQLSRSPSIQPSAIPTNQPSCSPTSYPSMLPSTTLFSPLIWNRLAGQLRIIQQNVNSQP